MEYYSAMRKEAILSFVTAWVDLEHMMPSEVSQTEKDQNCVVSLIRGV